jgi:hypothetical protein
MNRISRTFGSKLDLVYMTLYGEHVLSSADPRFTLQCLTSTSSHYLLFWDVLHTVWSSVSIANTFTTDTTNVGVYVASIDSSTLAISPETYLVHSYDVNGVAFDDVELWELNDNVTDVQVDELHTYLLAPRREIHRVSDTELSERTFDATSGGNELFRFTSVQDPSGAQPEETRTLTTIVTAITGTMSVDSPNDIFAAS